ncbi:MAG: hypothetical protein ACU837_15840 [Gammaproteobacteria bacterium]
MILLDTHIWHWWVNQIPGKLPQNTITFPAYQELDGRLIGR